MKKKGLYYVTGLVVMMFLMAFGWTALATEEVSPVVMEEEVLDEYGMPMIGIQDGIFNEKGVEAPKSEFAKDVERLGYLNLLPDFDVAWEADATWEVLAGILVKLDARKPGIVPANLVYNASPEKLTYAEAASVLVNLLKYKNLKDGDSVKHLNKLGINVNKVNIYDYLTGEELAHIVYKTLHQKQLDNKKSMLEDVYISNFKLAKDKVLKITSTTIEMEYQGTFTFASDMVVFKDDLAGTLTPVSKGLLAVGMKNAYLIVDENNIVQNIIMEGDFAPRDIRVLISSALTSTGGSSSYDFTSIKVAGSNGLKVVRKDVIGDHLLLDLAAGAQVTFSNVGGSVYVNGINAGNRVFVLNSEIAGSQITVYSTTRGGKNPSFDGNMEITPSYTAGKLYLVNDLYMEDYLHRVVPSEMPGYWPVQALAAQAVAARSYAYNHVLDSGYESRSANVDDSVNCQVYNNSAETANVIEAVDSTAGIIMTLNGKCITAFFSSTSSGYTASNEDVWHNASTGQFPGIPVPYVRALPQIPNYTYPDFNDEAAMVAYFKEVPQQGYDFISPYYRWSIYMTRQELENTISKNLPSRENADKILRTDFVQTISGLEPVGSTFHIGTLTDIKVVQRGQGGNFLAVEIHATNGVWRVWKEYNIRFVIRPTKAFTGSTRNVMLKYHTGSSYANYSILPSAFAAFDFNRNADGTIADVTIYGGGNGHGVGMSQWGARGMAGQGLTYDQILRNFYAGIELTDLW